MRVQRRKRLLTLHNSPAATSCDHAELIKKVIRQGNVRAFHMGEGTVPFNGREILLQGPERSLDILRKVTLLKPVWISKYALILYNAPICVLSPSFFLRDSFIVPFLKNRSTGIL